MERIQLAITDTAYRAALRELLERSGAAEVLTVETPDPNREGVIVVDSRSLERLPLPLAKPERVVLITHNAPEELSRAWNAGIRSVVFCEDPLNTAVLAILAAGLRCAGKTPDRDCCRKASSRLPRAPAESESVERDGSRRQRHENGG